MTTHWQSYRGGPTKTPGDVVNISINSKSVITLNRRAVNLLNGAAAVTLLFDEKNSIIGIVPSNRRNPEAFPLRLKNGSTWVIHAAPFCRHFHISPDRTERFDDPAVDDEGILRLDLKHTHNVSLRKRRAQAAP